MLPTKLSWIRGCFAGVFLQLKEKLTKNINVDRFVLFVCLNN